MAAVAVCTDWLVTSGDKKLIAVSLKTDREVFVFDCSQAEQKAKDKQSEGAEGGAEESGSDKVLAFAVSPSGKFCALTDDNKRLILFRTEPCWQCISTRWVVRRCTSLTFTQAEDLLLVADKSGDVYSYSVTEPQRDGELRLGHLSMLLAVVVSPCDRYVVTSDRDEKVRVSVLKAPHDIQSFCLGHREFVSSLFIPATHPHWLLSGSGDGTVRLWEYRSGCRLHSWDLKESSPAGKCVRFSVMKLLVSPGGAHIAVLCEDSQGGSSRATSVLLLRLDEKLREAQTLPLSCPVWDVAFDGKDGLWVLQESEESPVQLFTHSQDHWEQCEHEEAEVKRATEALRSHWDAFKDSVGAESRFQHLYKVNFDNMASYLQKKQHRIQQGTKRRPKASQHTNGEGKKAKQTSQE